VADRSCASRTSTTLMIAVTSFAARLAAAGGLTVERRKTVHQLLHQLVPCINWVRQVGASTRCVNWVRQFGASTRRINRVAIQGPFSGPLDALEPVHARFSVVLQSAA